MIGQLQQVVANLVSNAVDAVPVGGRVWVSAETVGACFAFEVRDAGSGMTSEMQRQIFQAFYSTKGDLGNGLGLYITQEIVERHGRVGGGDERGLAWGRGLRVELPAEASEEPAGERSLKVQVQRQGDLRASRRSEEAEEASAASLP